METDICPICSLKCKKNDVGDGKYIYCESGHKFTVHDSVDSGSALEVVRRYNLICEILLRTPYKIIADKKCKWKFFYSELEIGNDIQDSTKINLANNMQNYPFNFENKIDRILLNLACIYHNPQDNFIEEEKNARILFCNSTTPDEMRSEARAVLHLIEELGYIKHDKEKNRYSIAAAGWSRVSYLYDKEQAMNKGFIAMKFCIKTQSIREAFRKAICECHYEEIIIDEKEHNNQIVPEIFADISKSKFIVVDVTFPNYGAYYEAGYAQGLGKQVIVCCKKDVFEDIHKEKRPHFDISQKSMIVWDTEEELVKKLVRRIDATVGINSVKCKDNIDFSLEN